MSRLVRVLALVGLALGGLGALGWHRQPAPFARLWPPAWIDLPPGEPLYSGVIAFGAVSDWSKLWWPVLVVLPLFGAALGALLAALVPRRHQGVGGPVAIVVLGLLVGVASALSWHVDPGRGSELGWVGGLEEEIDYGYPAIGLVLGVLAALAARHTGLTDPGRRAGAAPEAR